MEKIGTRWPIAAIVYVAVSTVRLWIVAQLADAKGKTLDDIYTRWDAVHYLGIARAGYFEHMNPTALDSYQARLAFFPLYPFLLKLGHELANLDYVQVGLWINLIAGVAMVAGVMAVVKHMGWGVRAQIVAGVAIAGVPMGLTFNMVYTEALFGALSVWALWAMLERRWFLAGALVFFTCLTRLTGVDLWIVFALVVLVYGRRSLKAWLALALSPLGGVAYVAFVNAHTADVGGYFGLQKKGWGSAFDWGESTWGYLQWIFTRNADSWVVMVGLTIIVVVCLVLLSFGKMPWPVWLFAAGVTANIVLSDGTFTARPRLLIPAFLCLIPFAISFARSNGWARIAIGSVAWVVFGAIISAHPLIATGWAI